MQSLSTAFGESGGEKKKSITQQTCEHPSDVYPGWLLKPGHVVVDLHVFM